MRDYLSWCATNSSQQKMQRMKQKEEVIIQSSLSRPQQKSTKGKSYNDQIESSGVKAEHIASLKKKSPTGAGLVNDR